MANKTHKNLAPEIQAILSDTQKELIDLGLEMDRPFYICGPHIPTGKSTLAEALRELGVVVYEPFEMVQIELSDLLPCFRKPMNGPN